MNANASFVAVIPALAELEVAYKEAMEDPAFQVRGGVGAQCKPTLRLYVMHYAI
jgi:hypothetical protein